jgi:hypothetical protein
VPLGPLGLGPHVLLGALGPGHRVAGEHRRARGPFLCPGQHRLGLGQLGAERDHLPLALGAGGRGGCQGVLQRLPGDGELLGDGRVLGTLEVGLRKRGLGGCQPLLQRGRQRARRRLLPLQHGHPIREPLALAGGGEQLGPERLHFLRRRPGRHRGAGLGELLLEALPVGLGRPVLPGALGLEPARALLQRLGPASRLGQLVLAPPAR